jgi:hypothetical protein
MRARTKRFSVIGAALALVLAAGVVVAPTTTPPASAAVSCSYFKGLTTTGVKSSFSGVTLKKGEVIKATVSPARDTDTINLSTYVNGSILFSPGSAAVTGYTWTVPMDGTYTFTFQLTSTVALPSTVTWSYSATCASTTVSPSPTPTPTATTKPGKGKR